MRSGTARQERLDSIREPLLEIIRPSAEAAVTPLADRFGRVATDLRVSLTDRCNLRCTYCMPAEGLAWMPQPQQLTDDEVSRLVRIAVEQLGVTEVRFTGGEPLIRRGLVRIVTEAAQLDPGHDCRSPRTASGSTGSRRRCGTPASIG